MDFNTIIKLLGIITFIAISLLFIIISSLTSFMLIKYGQSKITTITATLVFFAILIISLLITFVYLNNSFL